MYDRFVYPFYGPYGLLGNILLYYYYYYYYIARYLNLTFTEIYCLKIRTTLAYLIRNNTIKDLFYVVNSRKFIV
jgi:hypothetical protein